MISTSYFTYPFIVAISAASASACAHRRPPAVFARPASTALMHPGLQPAQAAASFTPENLICVSRQVTGVFQLGSRCSAYAHRYPPAVLLRPDRTALIVPWQQPAHSSAALMLGNSSPVSAQTIGIVRREIVVHGTADKRGSATVAATLYTETPESIARREEQALQRKMAPPLGADMGMRPTKRDRRRLDATPGARKSRR